MHPNKTWLVSTGISVAVVLPLGALFLAGTMAGTRVTFDTGGDSQTSNGPGVIDIELGDLYVKPAKIDLAAGEVVRLNVTNAGRAVHDLSVSGEKGTEMLDPGESQSIEIGPLDEGLQLWCTVPGTRPRGWSPM